ncbi:putative disease resistance RPP13-like protein 1 [Alnus glutinosa]|uniref:putative disease resistance RPP13-like protein 1 n=1 Tax=Alnus glutinosa TaxID=3517 RepID=UPI002D78A519|nr:putative disease resistance RPP13-like protein 1 [Alnus glutinosa]
MAEALVGGAFLSAFLQVLFDRMASRKFTDFFRGQKVTDGLLEKLETTLRSVNVVLEDAEQKQGTKPDVTKWLDDLKDAVYHADDILDEIATKALRLEVDAEFQTAASKVRTRISTSYFFKKIEPKIKYVHERLEFLAKQKEYMGLREGVGGESSKRLPTTSLVQESDILGRNDDKETIVNLLLSDDTSGGEMCVIPIVGMGGVGKTTLAQIIYKDKRVNEHFELKAWVCVSDEFDVFRVTKTVLEVVTLSTCDIKDLNLLQVTLQEQFMGKKFLLVLDDVWNENYADWELLSSPFKSGAIGSTIIVTTRSDSVATIMRTVPTYRLKQLLEEDCWSLFAKHAFHDYNSDARPKLEVIGRQIAKKCKGLPLAAKTIGGLLRFKLDVNDWEKILKSELWDSPINKTNIVPALRLSYKYLPSHLKQCFAYCSIFPKDYVFEKDDVVFLWMAEGFLEETRNKTMEEIGHEYFLDLESRSLFEQSSGDKSSFLMHDLVNDLATFVSGQFTFRLEVDHSQKIVDTTRHFSYVQRSKYDNFKKFESLRETTRLHTFLPLKLSPSYNFFFLTKRVPLDLLPKLRCLRVLSLSHYRNITELPESIGKIKHLRYLNISFSTIKRLPDSICKLCNLQTLNLSDCFGLSVLPREIRKLINLRHLDISRTAIKEMPMQLGRLKCLQTLTKFIVSKHSGASIEELGNFANLRGKLSILELQNVVSPTDALKACLKDRKYLKELVLEWNALDANISECQISVLDNLRPHSNLKSLTINNYGGESLPDWVGHHSFSNIASICLENCKHCHNLPPLGQLPYLQDLSVFGFERVVKVDREFFYAKDSSTVKPFGALKILRFRRMLNWEEWSSFGAENEDGAFPQLEELYINNCPKLKGGLPVHLPSLVKFEIHECLQLVASLPKAPVACELKLRDCNEVLLKELPTKLRKLEIGGFDALESLPKGMVASNNCLQELEIRECMKLELPTHSQYFVSQLETLRLDGCDSLKSFPLDLFPKLYNMDIFQCKNLESFTISEQHGYDLVTLRSISIRNCPNFVSFPKGGICVPNLSSFTVTFLSLETLCLSGCDSLKSFPLDLFEKLYDISILGCKNLESFTLSEQHGRDLVTLRIEIIDCPNLVSFPKGGIRAPNLTFFGVFNCESLRSLPEKMHVLLPSLNYFQILNCPRIELFPQGGLPSNVKNMEVEECDKLFARRAGWGLQKLLSLRDFSVGGEYEDVESFPEPGLLPSCLTQLRISEFPNLKSLDKKGLQDLTSLQQLLVWDCPKLEYIPKEGLPSSLSIIEIDRCPLLRKRWQSKKGKERRKILDVDHILIDYEEYIG